MSLSPIDSKATRNIIVFTLILITIIVASFGIYHYNQNNGFDVKNPQNSGTVSSSTQSQSTSRILKSPKGIQLELDFDPKVTVACPFLIKGRIPGNWFFEGQFPIKVLDNNQNITTIIATASEDWMTTSPVQFEASYDCQNCKNNLNLLFEKDNPSGLPQNNDSILVPIVINCQNSQSTNNSTSKQKTYFKVFFTNNKSAQNCNKTFAAERRIPFTQGIGKAAIEQLLLGPNDFEKAQGFGTALPPNVKLNKLNISSKVATVDFSGELNQIGGSCRVSLIREQINQTLKQFPTIKNVVISVNGDAKTALQP
jgi:Sporulation and spore germination